MNVSLGFGRRHIVPALSKFARTYSEVEVQLHLSRDGQGPPLSTNDGECALAWGADAAAAW